MRAPPKLIVNATRENNPVRLRDRLRRHRPIPRVDRRLVPDRRAVHIAPAPQQQSQLQGDFGRRPRSPESTAR